MVLTLLITSSIVLLYLQQFFSDYWYLFLVWNFLLAIVPLGLNWISERYSQWKLWVLPFWIVFIPNSFYVLTDIIHPLGWWRYNPLTKSNLLRISQPTVSDLISLEFLMTCLWIIVCWVIGVWSYQRMKAQFQCLGLVWVKLGLSLLFSFGITLGRFARLNSWDLVQPVRLITKTWETSVGLVTIPSYGITMMVCSVLIFVSLVFAKRFEWMYSTPMSLRGTK
jgi:uncharacterized membrane protein